MRYYIINNIRIKNDNNNNNKKKHIILRQLFSLTCNPVNNENLVIEIFYTREFNVKLFFVLFITNIFTP